MNPSRNIRIAKLTLNIGAGKDQTILDKGMVLLQDLTGKKPVKTVTSKRIPGWGLRPGLPIGCKVTLRDDEAQVMLGRLLYARDNILAASHIDTNGNISFGIPEYIDIKDAKYNPAIGIIGLQACVTLERNGFRIQRRKRNQRPVPAHHRISKDEAIAFMKEQFKVTIEGES